MITNRSCPPSRSSHKHHQQPQQTRTPICQFETQPLLPAALFVELDLAELAVEEDEELPAESPAPFALVLVPVELEEKTFK